MGQKKSNVANVHGNRENQLSPEEMDKQLKWLSPTGIYHQRLPADAKAGHVLSLLGPGRHIALWLSQLYPQYAWAKCDSSPCSLACRSSTLSL